MCSWEHASHCHRITHDLPAYLGGMPARWLSREWHGTNFLKLARRFVDATGRLPKLKEHYGENNIGTWLMKRRAENKLGILSGERIQLIQDALGVDVLVPLHGFERKLADVAEYRRSHGRLPARSGDADQLGVWLMKCRQDANDGALPEVHTQRLDTVLGAEWRPAFKNDTVCSHVTTPFGNLTSSTHHAGIICGCADMCSCMNRSWWHFHMSSHVCVVHNAMIMTNVHFAGEMAYAL